MRSDRFSLGDWVGRWIGIALSLMGIVATMWLAGTGKLELYIHPRYTVFSVIMVSLAGVLAIAGIVLRGGPESPHGHDEDGGHDALDALDALKHPDDRVTRPRRSGRTALVTAGRAVIFVGAAVALLILPPAALSAQTAQSRGLATTNATLVSTTSPKLVGGATTSFTVKDWSDLLRSGGPSEVEGKPVEITAYVARANEQSAGGSSSIFYAARLLITCCAVDAQPIGIPVYVPGWAAKYPANGWVKIIGRFEDNPDASSDEPTVVVPTSIAKIAEPSQPYVY